MSVVVGFRETNLNGEVWLHPGWVREFRKKALICALVRDRPFNRVLWVLENKIELTDRLGPSWAYVSR